MITHYWPHEHQRNVRRPEVVELGLFHEGEIPPPLEHTFLDYDFSDPTFDWTVAFEVTGPGDFDLTGTPVFSGGGTVVYTWVAGDMDVPGTYEGKLVVEDVPLHNRMASSLFRWRVV